MPEQTALGILHDVEKIIGIEILTNHSYGQSTDEFRLEAVLHKVLRRHVLEQFVVHHLNWLRAESDLTVPDAPCHLFLQLFKRATHHEQNVPSVDRLASCFAAPLKFERSL